VGTAGEYRVRIQYAEGDNYNFGATQYVSFTIKKESVLTIKNIIGPDGNPIAGITDSALGIKYGENRINMQAQIDGLCEYLTNTANAEKYFIIRVQCGETVIARFERRGVQTMSDLNYVYTYGGMSFDNDRVTGMHFDLFGANEYVSAEGKWIGNEDLEITIEITHYFVFCKGATPNAVTKVLFPNDSLRAVTGADFNVICCGIGDIRCADKEQLIKCARIADFKVNVCFDDFHVDVFSCKAVIARVFSCDFKALNFCSDVGTTHCNGNCCFFAIKQFGRFA